MPVVDPAIEAYVAAHTTPPPPLLVALAEETSRTLESPGMMVGAVEGRFLQLLVFATGARRVLESAPSAATRRCPWPPACHPAGAS